MGPCIVRPSFVLLLSVVPFGRPLLSRPSRAEEPDSSVTKFEAIAHADTMLMVPIRDGTGLSTDVRLPKDRDGPFPVIFVKTPYDFNRIEGVPLEWGIEAIERGCAGVVQNERGRLEGEWELLGRPRKDGFDPLGWRASRIVLPVVPATD